MPAVGFICPDGTKIRFRDCLSACRKGRRCLSLPTLRFISRQREWQGIPSVTQLIKGTRQAFLEITRPYFIDPKSRAYSLLGISTHGKLETPVDDVIWLSETPLTLDLGGGLFTCTLSGIPDVYDGIERTLYDYKTSGSYAVAQAINGEKREWVLQLNAYRLMIEGLGYRVDRMVIQAIARDGNTWIAKKRGIDEAIVMIEMPRMDDNEVVSYFRKKAEALRRALDTGYAPPCSDEETWGGKRCEKYCDVADFCRQMEKI